MKSLDDILSDEGEEAAETVEAPAVEQPAETVESPPRDEQGRFAPKGVEESAPPAPATELPKEEFAGLKDERRKRQEAEARLVALEQQLAEMRNPPAPPPSMWEDEQGWQNHFGGQIVKTAVEQATTKARLDMSEMMAAQAYPDFAEVRTELIQMLNDHPELNAQVANDPHPWAKAYQINQSRKAMQELGATNLTELEAKLREQIKAEMQQQAPAAPALPNSLATAQNARTGAAAVQRPLSLDDILNGKG